MAITSVAPEKYTCYLLQMNGIEAKNHSISQMFVFMNHVRKQSSPATPTWKRLPSVFPSVSWQHFKPIFPGPFNTSVPVVLKRVKQALLISREPKSSAGVSQTQRTPVHLMQVLLNETQPPPIKVDEKSVSDEFQTIASSIKA